MKEIVLVELFSGIGGFAKGLLDAGFIIKKHYFSEIDKHAIANYKYNFPDAEHIGSVKDVSGNGIEQPDIITFGWPCQDNSIAGKRKGQRDGTRSGLLFEAGRIILKLKPRYFIAENVKGLFSVNEGIDFYESIRFLTYLNTDSPQYTVEMQLLNTSWFLPQNRERVYFVGHIGTGSIKRLFPIGENIIQNADTSINIVGELNSSQDGKIFDTNGKVQTLSAGHGNVPKIKCLNPMDGQDFRVYENNGIAATLGSGHSNVPKIVAQRGRNIVDGKRNDYLGAPTVQRLEVNNNGVSNALTSVGKDNLLLVRSATNNGYEVAQEGDSINLSVPDSETRRGRVGKGKAQTLDTQCNQAVIVQHRSQSNEVRVHNDVAPTVSSTYGMGGGNIPYVNNIRKLTEIECERLQGYPDNWTQYGIYEEQVWINKKEKTFEIVKNKHKIPKTQRYKLCGNAVTTNCVKEIGKKLL